MITQAVFLCGGLGERLKPLTNHIPKPMMDVNGKPFLWHLLEQLAEKGIKKFLLLTGYLGQSISDYFGTGEKWGWQIDYSPGPVEWDTGRRLWEARSLLEDEFLLAYSDNFVQIRLDLLVELWEKTKAPIALHLAPKKGGNIRIGSNGLVEEYDATRKAPGLAWVEVGYMFARKEKVLTQLSELEGFPNISFSKVIHAFARQEKLAGIVIHDPYHSIGDIERLENTRRYLSPKKIILIDRDGTINRKAPRGEYIGSWEGFEFIPETLEAMKELAQDGFEFIVITNQAGVARGMVDSNKLDDIHKNMIEKFKQEGVTILRTYVCTDHWDTQSFRRKPNPGMFFEAAGDFNLRLDKTLYVGDDPRDCEAAYKAGTNCVYIGDTFELENLNPIYKPFIQSNKKTTLAVTIKKMLDKKR
jgi:D-glycero-D-manno-heptose 1,7-bisphosphate phosphatase